MAEVSVSLVKELRDKTGAGMMDCKKALSETKGDLEAAVDWLRKKGLSAAARKAGRVAAEGLIGIALAANRGAIVEVNAETDFVARNERFQRFVSAVAAVALDRAGNLEAVKGAPYPGAGRTVAEELNQLVATIGENMNLRRMAVLEVDRGVVAGYVHSALAPGIGKIGVLVALETRAEAARLGGLAKQLAMHVAAAAPQAVSREGVDAAAVERERTILAEQARASGKPENLVAKMVEGRLRKFYEDVCLLEQTFVIDGESKVGAVLERAAKEAGCPIVVKGFVRFALGEGIERKATDFAAEVAAATGR